MNKITKYAVTLPFMIIIVSFPVRADINREIITSIKYAYNFQFDESRKILEKYILDNPDDPGGYAGRVVYDFLIINQNPDKNNIAVILNNLRDFELRIDILLQQDNSAENRFYKCFIDYYFMKSHALNSSWLQSFSRASKSRALALDLREYLDILPDLYFILGDQDYTSSLVPQSIQPFMKAVSFKPDPETGLKLIEKAMQKGVLTRYEAMMFYISSLIYIEKDFPGALEVTEMYLEKFPANLSARFYKIDLLLRDKRIDDARQILNQLDKDIASGKIGGKWISRYYQMYGNYYNSLGNYNTAIEYYEKALEYGDISGYTLAEITLETGKLYDITGDRKNARLSYWRCEKSGGLIIHREEAKLLRDKGYSGTRGSY
jgi:tetratricopeptide (TPR) repeat protein